MLQCVYSTCEAALQRIQATVKYTVLAALHLFDSGVLMLKKTTNKVAVTSVLNLSLTEHPGEFY